MHSFYDESARNLGNSRAPRANSRIANREAGAPVRLLQNGKLEGSDVKIFYYMGRNAANKSGVSWKIWKVRRAGRSVTASWGPARLVKRKVVPAGTLQSKALRFTSPGAACEYERRRIREKLGKGYERRTRRQTK
jgi:hypothetical protein